MEKFYPKLQDKIWNGEPRFEARSLPPHCSHSYTIKSSLGQLKESNGITLLQDAQVHREEGRRRDGDDRGNGRLEENGRGRRKRRNRDIIMKKKTLEEKQEEKNITSQDLDQGTQPRMF